MMKTFKQYFKESDPWYKGVSVSDVAQTVARKGKRIADSDLNPGEYFVVYKDQVWEVKRRHAINRGDAKKWVRDVKSGNFKFVKNLKEQAQTKDKTVWDVYDERDHYWPVIKGWQEVDWDKCDRFNTCASISLQDYRTGVIVTFDASKLQQGGKGPGTYSYEYWGRKQTGKFKDVNNLKNVIRAIQKQLPKIKNAQIKSVPKSIAGFNVEGNIGDSDVDISYTRNITNDQIVSVNVFDIGEILAGGSGDVMVSVDDHGGYERAQLFQKTFMASGIDGLKKLFGTILKDLKKHGIIM
jgi:hypothetical protein